MVQPFGALLWAAHHDANNLLLFAFAPPGIDLFRQHEPLEFFPRGRHAFSMCLGAKLVDLHNIIINPHAWGQSRRLCVRGRCKYLSGCIQFALHPDGTLDRALDLVPCPRKRSFLHVHGSFSNSVVSANSAFLIRPPRLSWASCACRRVMWSNRAHWLASSWDIPPQCRHSSLAWSLSRFSVMFSSIRGVVGSGSTDTCVAKGNPFQT
jgi:hypothetical protein